MGIPSIYWKLLSIANASPALHTRRQTGSKSVARRDEAAMTAIIVCKYPSKVSIVTLCAGSFVAISWRHLLSPRATNLNRANCHDILSSATIESSNELERHFQTGRERSPCCQSRLWL